MNTPTVYIIDDEPNVRKSLAWLLGSVNLPTRMYASAEDFIQSGDVSRPGCVVLDLRLPGMSGLTLLEMLATIELSPLAILVTAYGTVDVATRAMKKGATHVIEKPYDDQQLIDAVHEAILLDSNRRTALARKAEGIAKLSLLSNRERELLNLIVDGHSNKSIARKLALSTKTVEFHRANLMSKLEVRTLADLLRFAIPLLYTNNNTSQSVSASTKQF